MRQYTEIKSLYPDALLLFRVGDFYETFDEDAIKCSKTLNIVLTKRFKGSSSETKLAGFPYHALDNYLPKLVLAGFRVAICDQLEDPKTTKKLVKRGVISLITPGVVLNDGILPKCSNNFLAVIHFNNETAGLAILDISTGEFLVTENNLQSIYQIIHRFSPSEIIYQKNKKYEFEKFIKKEYFTYSMEEWAFKYSSAYEKLIQHFKTHSLKGFGIEHLNNAIIAAGATLFYLEITHNTKISHLSSISRIDEEQYVWMDDFTVRSLEIFHSNNPNGISLFDVLNRTLTPMGTRLLKRWMMFPLKELSAIQSRHDLLETFIIFPYLSYKLIDIFCSLNDIERLISKVSTEKINPRELMNLCLSLDSFYTLKKILSTSQNNLLKEIGKSVPNFRILYKHISKALHEDPPQQIGKGNIIAEFFSKELDEFRYLVSSGKDYLHHICKRERIRTGIQSLKISFNKIFGFYIEIRNIHKNNIPKNWIRKQTLSNSERYITEELHEYEMRILGAEEKILTLEKKLFKELVAFVGEYIESLQKASKLIAYLDVILSFTKNSQEYNYVRPIMDSSKNIFIEKGRHPVIEKHLPIGVSYIPNDLSLNSASSQILILTGPNMSGKSAFLRQTALIVLMAQIGSYVPAKRAQLGLVDKIFSRVGAYDNITLGESTFMVEMNETANILNNLSKRSLIILDEVGRGTSNYDGISIAWSVIEYLYKHSTRPKTLFATHYPELNEMSVYFQRIKNYTILVKELDDKILFMYKLLPGNSTHSFGIYVANMSGMPNMVISRAKQLLKHIDKFNMIKILKLKSEQISTDKLLYPILEKILSIDINMLTPLEALIKLNEIKKRLCQLLRK
ncbi:DNA mismatch repair protein MutS [Candidatus Walczuchella endosymbiont of Icerya purchasi]|uniref:DNA mismatch repair protein MutS n=1 Tax=Candidatus Walczuchella endosymbiont of Icerya purchasi TaxID=3066219 RepID=UPI00313D86FA